LTGKTKAENMDMKGNFPVRLVFGIRQLLFQPFDRILHVLDATDGLPDASVVAIF